MAVGAARPCKATAMVIVVAVSGQVRTPERYMATKIPCNRARQRSLSPETEESALPDGLTCLPHEQVQFRKAASLPW